MFRYFLYAVPVASQIKLPGVQSGVPHGFRHLKPNILIRRAHHGECTITDDSTPGLTVVQEDKPYSSSRLYWRSVGMFELHIAYHPHELVYRAMPGVDPSVVGTFILHNALSLLLLTDVELFLFHASAVRLRDGRGVALAGRSGAGKSTLAAALIERGHTLLADDVTAIAAMDRKPYKISPAFPQLKLHADSAQALGLSSDVLHPSLVDAKLLYVTGDPSKADEVPLTALYLLDDEDCAAPTLETLSLQEAFAAVLAASYNAHIERLLNVDVWAAMNLKTAFTECCSRLARSVAVKRLKRPRDLARLHEVAALIEADNVPS